MSYTVSQLKDELTGIVHSTSLSKVTNLDVLIARAARTVLAKIDPPDTIRIAQITNAVHDDIYDYAVPSDLKGVKIIDIRPQTGRTESDSFSQRFSAYFDKYKSEGLFNVRHNNGTKTLRLSAEIDTAPTTVHNMNSLTENGTWAVAGAGTNLTLDTLNYITGSKCFNFDATGLSVSVSIQTTNMTALDLSTLDEIGEFFLWVYLPDTSIVTSVSLVWGNDLTANYWTATATTPFDYTSWQTGWNLVKFSWNGATEMGTVAPATIDSIKITITQSSTTAETDYRADYLICSAGEIYEMEYYSENLFRTSGGTWQAAIDDDTNIINLDEDDYNILVFECGVAISQQVQGANAVFDKNFFNEELFGAPIKNPPKIGLYQKYRADHPSQAIKPQAIYGTPWRYKRG